MIQLTKQDTPSRPVLINPQYVTSVTPLRKTLPSTVSQIPGQTQIVYTGTKLTLSDGTYVNVLEDYQVVIDQLVPAEEPQWEETSRTPSIIPTEQFRDLDLKDHAQESQFIDSLKQAGVPVSDHGIQADLEQGVQDAHQEAEELRQTQPETTPVVNEVLPESQILDATEDLSPAEKRKRTLEAKKAAEGKSDVE